MSSIRIGKTPLIYIDKYGIYAKFERNNPIGSVKDRPVYFMIRDAIKSGKINENTVFVEPTSGNTGIALAWLGARLGLKVILTMPESVSVERRNILKALGADLVLVENMTKAVEKAQEIVSEKKAFMPNQFENPANSLAHEITTGPEILEEMNFLVDAFVAGVGTGGTITGVGRVLKRLLKENVKVCALEPLQSPVLTNGISGKHRIQGIAPGFVPKILDRQLIDEIKLIDDEEALNMMKILWKEGLFVGVSSAANLLGAIYIKEKYKFERVVTIFPDDGTKYLSLIQ
ncbi:cysteine synthase [Fervidobacterium sp. SC_NGM5_G05]|nr:cysteine synthase [Fervidobacterium sp. SC_NGM5_G05]